MNRILASLMAGLAGIVMSGVASAQDNWPSKPIMIVSPGAPGSSSEILIRAIFEPVSRKLGVQILPDFKPGAGTTIAAKHTASQPADGYTFFLASVAPLAIAPRVFVNAQYDPLADFTGVAQLTATQNILFLNKDVPANSLADFVALAKATPGKLNLGIGGAGTSYHMASILFTQSAGIDVAPIVYKTNVEAVQAVLAGEVDASFDNLITVVPHVQSGAVKALAVSSAQRDPRLPDVPTMIEAGIPGYDVTSWFGLVAPAGTPPAIVERMSAEVAEVLKDPKTVEMIENLGNSVVYKDPAAFDAFFRAENARWKPIVEASGVKVE